jgi:hypothetical protein
MQWWREGKGWEDFYWNWIKFRGRSKFRFLSSSNPSDKILIVFYRRDKLGDTIDMLVELAEYNQQHPNEMERYKDDCKIFQAHSKRLEQLRAEINGYRADHGLDDQEMGELLPGQIMSHPGLTCLSILKA